MLTCFESDYFKGAYAAQKAISENLVEFGNGAYFAPMSMALHGLFINGPKYYEQTLQNSFIRACVCAFIEHTEPGILYYGDSSFEADCDGHDLNEKLMKKLDDVCNDPKGLADLIIEIETYINLIDDGDTPGHKQIEKWLERMQ